MSRFILSIFASAALLAAGVLATNHHPQALTQPTVQMADGSDPTAPPWPLPPAA